jgi:integrase
MNGCGDSFRTASGKRGQRREPPAAARASLPMSRQARGLGRIFRPRSRDKRTGQVTEYSIWWIEYSVRSEQYRESSRSRNPVVARQLLKQRLGDVAAGTFIGPQRDRTTFDDLAQMVIDDYKANGKRSLDRIEDAINHLRVSFGGMKAIDITADRVTAYTAARKAEHAANATVNRELSALRRMFRLGERAGKVAGRPYVALLREDNIRTGFFEPEQFAAVRARLPEDLRPAVEFAYLTGWRLKSEVLALQWWQVDFEAGMVRLEPGSTKNADGRVFPFAALPALEGLLRTQAERTRAIERASGSIIPWVFHRHGRPIQYFRRTWIRACRLAGLPGRLPHDFRRTAVRNLERAGVPRSVAMKLTGHKTESIYRRYAIVAEQDLKDGVAKLAALHERGQESRRTIATSSAQWTSHQQAPDTLRRDRRSE